MNHIKGYKLFEELSNKPIKKFPTDKAVHFNYLIEILKNAGLDPYELKKGLYSSSLQDFCFEKCSNQVVYPNMIDSKGWSDEGQSDRRYEKFIFRESVFLLPMSYDGSNDVEIYKNKKEDFFKNMKNIMGFKTKSAEDDFRKTAEKNVQFGPSKWDWINPALGVIQKEFSEHYKDDKLRIWIPADRDYDPWVGYDYPHKYNVVGDLDRPDGVYYLSDIEKYIDDRYGIRDDDFYKFIIHNEYIEGRYWERVWSLNVEDKDKTKLQKKNFGKYGMESTENITHILNIIEKDFDINGSDYEGFPIYIDYYEKIAPKY